MEKYTVIKLNNSQYEYLIIANSYENPINDFLANGKVPDIINGNAVFDLALINGVEPNRYIFAQINDNKINTSSIKIISDIDAEIQRESKAYFNSNKILIKNSALPSALKYWFLNSYIKCQKQ